MADTATATAPPISDLTGDDSIDRSLSVSPDLQSNLREITKGKMAADAQVYGQMGQQLNADQDRVHAAYDARGVHANDIQPWNAAQETAKTKSNPLESFGSLGMIMGLAASAFSRQPALNAVNAMASGMEAIKAGDKEAYDRSFDAWKANTDLMLKRHQMEHQDFTDAIQLMQTDSQLGEVKLRMAAARYGDQKALVMIDSGMIPEVIELQASKAKAAEGMAKAREEILQMNIKKQAWDQYTQEHPNATALEKAQFLQELNHRGYGASSSANTMNKEEAKAVEDYIVAHPEATRLDAIRAVKEAGRAPPNESMSKVHAQAVKEWMESHPGASLNDALHAVKQSEAVVSGNKREDQRAMTEKYSYSLQKIDEALGVLESYIGAAGAVGKARRLGEGLGNLMGNNQTDRKQFERNIAYLQDMAPELLHERGSGRPLSAESKKIETIIAGLNLGDTTANTRRALQEVKRLYQQMQADLAARVGDEPRSSAPAGRSEPIVPGGGPTKEGGGWWNSFPDAK